VLMSLNDVRLSAEAAMSSNQMAACRLIVPQAGQCLR